MRKKIRVGLLFGGKSGEHEISLLSARNVLQALDPDKYEVVLIGIDKRGRWHLSDADRLLPGTSELKSIERARADRVLALVPRERGSQLITLSSRANLKAVDVIFPILHGVNGEDGTVQGFLKLAQIPYVGAGVLGSAIGMDKELMKRLLRDAGIPTARFLAFQQHELHRFPVGIVVKKLGLPFFVKPSNAGSSVGITKVKTQEQYGEAVKKALSYDRKIICEEYIQGREIECSVLGNEHPIVSLPGEVIPQHEFYSYEAKYLDPDGAHFKIPVELPLEILSSVQSTALKAFKVLLCEGMARVDFFLKENGEVILNEINTIPGFTNISMYPKLWEASGIPYAELIDRLLMLALERFEKEQNLKISYI